MKNYFAHLLVFAVLAVACASCSEEEDEFGGYDHEGKYILPFKVKIVDEDQSTRLIFNGASQQGGGAGSARNLLWTEDDELAFTATNFPADKKIMPYKMHVEDELLAIYGEEPLPVAANTSYTLQSVYPYQRVIGYNGTNIEAELPTVQNGTVNKVHSTSPKAILCPEGQESSEYDAVNITDYTSCLLYAFADVTTGADKNLTSTATLTYRVRVRGFDVIIDAPKHGSATLNEVDVEVGTYDAEGVFKSHTTEFFTGTITDISNSAGTLKNDSKRSTKIQLKFAPTTISGTDRIVARLYAVRKSIPSGLYLKITTKCSAIDGDASKAKNLYQIVALNQPIDNTISHFYLGQIPTSEEYVDLGLSVYWATKNLGAASATSPGNYYAWAADKSASPFTFDTYKTFPTKSNEAKLGTTLNKTTPCYNNPQSVGSLDIKGSTYDIAHLELGGKWHMPNQEQWNELATCTWTWDSANQGYTVTGPNGNSIFIPAAGYMDNTTQTATADAYYWSSTREESTQLDKKSYAFCATSSAKDSNSLFLRHLGMLIRPVRDK